MKHRDVDESLIQQNVVRAFEEHRFADAVRMLEPLAWGREDPELFNNLGALYFQMDWLRLSEWAFRRTLEIEPTHQEAISNLCDQYLHQGLYYSAIRVLQDASEKRTPEVVWQEPLEHLQQAYPVEKVTLVIHSPLMPALLDQCLNGISEQSHPVHEVLMVHVGEVTPALTLARDHGVKIIPMVEPQGGPGGFNLALKHATGNYFGTVEVGTRLEPTWLERVMLQFRDATIAGVGGRLREYHSECVADRWRQRVIEQHWGPGRLSNPRALFSSNAVYRVPELRTLEGWDTHLDTHLADFDLSARLKSAGFNLVYEGAACALHMRTQAVTEVVDEAWLWNIGTKLQKGFYEDIHAAIQCLPANRGSSIKTIDTLITSLRSELLYPSFLMYFRWSLLDLDLVSRRTQGLRDAVSQTALGLFIIVRNRLAGAYKMPTVVIEQVLHDLRDLLLMLLEPNERSRMTSPESLEELAPLSLHDLDSILRAVAAVLPKANQDYLEAFDNDLVINHLGNGVGVLVALSLRHIRLGEARRDEGTQDQPVVILLNPPAARGDQQAASGDGRADKRWLEPSRIEALGCSLEEGGARVYLIDAVQEKLDESGGLARIWSLGPDCVVFSAAEGGLERLMHFARLIKTDEEREIKTVLVNSPRLADEATRSRYPMFDLILDADQSLDMAALSA